tara:strand:+ start:3107 stop:3340 length:234 start_codon:yes stop_codon:yes gene_type:complete
MTTNTYATLRKNASLIALAEAAEKSAARAWAAQKTYKEAMPKPWLISCEHLSYLTALTNGATERSDLAKHLTRLATK